MKQRVREAMFNLIGPGVTGKHAIDLFAGSGALGLEAISRGASSATFIERHIPTAKLLRQNIAAMGVEDRTEVLTASAFVWAERPNQSPKAAWVVFCSPPYDYYAAQRPAMFRLIQGITNEAPEGSILVVEADDRLDFANLPDATAWDVRSYRPARLGVRTIRADCQ
jgi:16S rRNA (guanine(966)-N(2))-methyltransferase RsmD